MYGKNLRDDEKRNECGTSDGVIVTRSGFARNEIQ